jgi:HEAT repeat protein
LRSDLVPSDRSLLLTLDFLAALWAGLSLWVLVGRALFRIRRRVSPRRTRSRGRLLSAATSRRPKRRARALASLVQAGDPARAELLRRALGDRSSYVRAAAVALAAELEGDGDGILLEALVHGALSRSRVAAELEHRVPRVRIALEGLAADPEPTVRFWALTLLAGLAECDDRLARIAAHHADDADAQVRSAAADVLARSPRPRALLPLHTLLGDDVFFVRAHAARSLAACAGPAAARWLVPLLADPNWWVRAAAKESLIDLGTAGVDAALPALTHVDRFARDAAREIVAASASLVLDEPDVIADIFGGLEAAG